jgi:hypothetical protein
MEGKEKKYKRMSVLELKAFKGLEEISEEKAGEIIESLEQFAIIMFNLYQKLKSDEQNGGITIAEFCKRQNH